VNSPVGLQYTSELVVERIGTSQRFRELEPEWVQLEQQSIPQPFNTFDWCWAWWETWHEQRFFIKDELLILAFRESNGRLQGIAPLVMTTRPGVGWFATREIQSFGIDPSLTELRSIIAARHQSFRIYATLLHYLRQRSHDWDWLALSGMMVDDELTRVVESLFAGVEQVKQVPNYVLDLPSSYAQFRASLPRNIKESLRKCQNSLKRANWVPSFRVLGSSADVDAGLTTFLRLHRARAAMTDTISHRDAFATERSRAFLVAVCHRFAARGRLRIFQLCINDIVVATRIGFACADTLYLYFSGFDPAYAQYSVMTTLLNEIIKRCIDAGLAQVNLSTGRDEAKLRWRPREILYRDVLITSPTLRGKAARDLARFAKRTLRGAFESSGVPDCLVRWRD
jgi:CelD/BcsL family acetyltransferase involved in cellulose biosynthesis